MTKGNMLHPQLASLLAQTGHTDQIGVVDAGFPVPSQPERIDLAWRPEHPTFQQVCEFVGQHLVVEKLILADQMEHQIPQQFRMLCDCFPGILVEAMPHSQLKQQMRQARGVIRTGEFTPFCNCILVAGVAF